MKWTDGRPFIAVVVVVPVLVWLSCGLGVVDAKVYATQMSPRVVDTQFGKLALFIRSPLDFPMHQKGCYWHFNTPNKSNLKIRTSAVTIRSSAV